MQGVEGRDGDVLIRLRLQPRAKRNAILVEADGRIRVAVTAPPVEGAANKALRALVAKSLGVGKGGVTLVSGSRSRDKTLKIAGVSVADVVRKLESNTNKPS